MSGCLSDGWRNGASAPGGLEGTEGRDGRAPTLDRATGEVGDVAHAVNSRYVAHLGGPERLGELVWTEAQRRGGSTLPQPDRQPWGRV